MYFKIAIKNSLHFFVMMIENILEYLFLHLFFLSSLQLSEAHPVSPGLPHFEKRCSKALYWFLIKA